MTAAFHSAARAMLKLVVPMRIQTLGWRHHGLGMLQAEITDDIRIHVWHPKLKTIPSGSLREVHDHRFDITSAVISGVIEDVPWEVGERVKGVCYSTEMFEIKHAKIQDGVADDCRSLGKVRAQPMPSRKFEAGEVYTIDRRQFHTTHVGDLAVTVVHRSNFDNKPARILGHADQVREDEKHAMHKPITVDSGIVRNLGTDEQSLRLCVLEAAENALREAVG